MILQYYRSTKTHSVLCICSTSNESYVLSTEQSFINLCNSIHKYECVFSMTVQSFNFVWHRIWWKQFCQIWLEINKSENATCTGPKNIAAKTNQCDHQYIKQNLRLYKVSNLTKKNLPEFSVSKTFQNIFQAPPPSPIINLKTKPIIFHNTQYYTLFDWKHSNTTNSATISSIICVVVHGRIFENIP